MMQTMKKALSSLKQVKVTQGMGWQQYTQFLVLITPVFLNKSAVMRAILMKSVMARGRFTGVNNSLWLSSINSPLPDNDR